MPPFYNRDPWNLLIGFASMMVLLLVLAAVTSWWLLLAPIVPVVAIHAWIQARRVYALMTIGFHSRTIRQGRLIYEERSGRWTRSFILNLEITEPGHYELFVPSESEWAQSVPHWAAERRAEIAERIANSWRRDDVHILDEPINA